MPYFLVVIKYINIMSLLLAVHKIQEVTAKVSFSIIQLQDLIKTKQTPEGFKCRHVFPTSGEISVSVWDYSGKGNENMDGEEVAEQATVLLLSWLTEHLNSDCTHEVYSIQEAFALGLGEVNRARTAEKIASGTAQVADKTAKAVKDLDSKMHISEKTGNAVGAVKDSQVYQQAGAALTRAGSTVKSGYNKVIEQPVVANAAESVGTGFKRLTSFFTSSTHPQHDENVQASPQDPPKTDP